ncbi:hypothetical protein ACA910_013305 [Epithemia clementina (nom. ined.)]
MDDDVWGDGWSEDEDDDNNKDGEGDDDGEDVDDWMNSNSSAAQHYLCLIDCNSTMWKNNNRNGSGESAIAQILSFLNDFVRLNVQEQVMFHTGKRNCVAVLMYNTKYRTPKERNSDGQEEEAKDDRMNEAGDDEEEDDHDVYYANDRKTTVHELIPITKPGIATVRDIRQAREQIASLEKDYVAPPGEDDEDDDGPEYCPLQLALDHGIKHMERASFVKSKSTPSSPKTDRIQVWIWTNDPKPHRGDDLRGQIKDLKDEGRFNLVVWGMPRQDATDNNDDGRPFDYSQFYESLLPAIQTPLRDKTKEEMQNLTDTIMPELRTFWKPTRPIYRRLPFLLPDWKETGVERRNAYLLDWYRLTQTSKKPNLLTISQQTGYVVQSLRQLVTKQHQDVLFEQITGSKTRANPSTRLRSFIPFGDDRVPLTEQDKKIIKKGSNSNSEFASLILIGFRPKDAISDLLAIESSYVCLPPPIQNSDIDPEEEAKNHANNFHAIACLHQAMQDENVVAVGELLTRVTSTSRLVALWPLPPRPSRKDDEDESDGAPPHGVEWPAASFLASPLPFADEVRSAKAHEEHDSTAAASGLDELVDAFSGLVQKQTLRDAEIGESFQNAHLVQYWEYVEKLAHQESLDKKQEDEEKRDYEGTVVDNEEILRIAKAEIEKLENLLPAEHPPATSRKGSTSQKKRKKDLPDDDSGLDWMDLFRSKEIDTASVAQLKSKLKSLGERVAGKKADLVERVANHLQKEWELEAKVKSEA